MRLLEKIIAEMHLSMKSGHREKASALRTLVSKLKDQEIKLRKEISDEEDIANGIKDWLWKVQVFNKRGEKNE